MALNFTFLGYTAHEVVYLAEGDDTGFLDALTILADVKPDSPIGRFLAQACANQAQARKLVFGVGLLGESSVPPLQIGEAYLVPRLEFGSWYMDVDDDGANLLRFQVWTDAVVGDGIPAAYLRIRVKHTFDR